MMEGNEKLQRSCLYYLKTENIVNPIFYILTYLTVPMLILLLSIFILLKQIVYIALKLKYKNSFGGILESADAVWAVEGTSKTIINIVVKIKVKTYEDAVRQIKNIISEKIFKQPDQFPKLTSARMRILGFNFLLKNRVTVDDCVSTIQFENEDDPLTEITLQKVVSEYTNGPLPKDNSALWEILVSSKPMHWNERKESINVFPVLIRFSHIVGDGLSLTNLFVRTFNNDEPQNSSSKLIQHTKNVLPYSTNDQSTQDILTKLGSIIKNGLKLLVTILTAPSLIVYQNVLRKADVNALHGCPLSGDKIVVCAVEKEKQLLPVVKKIKGKVPGSKFSDILLSAISGSLENYFSNKCSQRIPDFATTAIPALLSLPNMDSKPVLRNQFSVALLDLPIFVKSESMLKRLQEVMRQTDKLRRSPDYQVNHWLLTLFCGIIPHPILCHFLKCDTLTMTVSNVPGLPKLSVLDDSDVEDIVFYTPHRGTAGVGFSILTYDDRFQLGLEVDKSLISSAVTAQLIVNDIFRCVNVLGEELFPIKAHSKNGLGV